jgi:hypothetical protein
MLVGRARITMVTLLVAACARDDHPPPSTQSESVAVASDSAAVVGLLRTVKRVWNANNNGGVFDASKSAPLDADSVLVWLADEGLSLYDINSDSTWTATRDVIRRELSERNGRTFVQLVHLGSIASIAYPQYSALTLERSSDSTSATLGHDNYRIVVSPKGDSARVRRIEYRMRHDK